MAYQTRDRAPLLDRRTQAAVERRGKELLGLALLAGSGLFAVMLATYSPDDPNWMLASDEPARNWLGRFGASVAHPLVMILGHAAWAIPLALGAWGLRLATHRGEERARAVLAPLFVALLAVAWAALTPDGTRAAGFGWGGLFGDTVLGLLLTVAPALGGLLTVALWAGAVALGLYVLGFTRAELAAIRRWAALMLVLGYDAALRLAGQGARGLGQAAREGRGRAQAMLERRAARRAEDSALLEAEDRALRAAPASHGRSAAPAGAVPVEPAAGPAAPRGASRVPVVRAPSAPTGLDGRRAHLMPPPLRSRAGADLLAGDWSDVALEPDPVPAAPAAAPLVAPPRPAGPAAPPPGFLSTLLRRARGAAEGDPAPEPLDPEPTPEPDHRPSAGDAPETCAEEAVAARGMSAALAAALQVARGRAAAPAGPRPEPPLAAPGPAGAVRPEPPLARPAPVAATALEPRFADEDEAGDEAEEVVPVIRAAPRPVARPAAAPRDQPRPAPNARPYEAPPLDLLADPARVERHHLPDDRLAENARDLEGVLDDYGVKGEIASVRPGPVVTMYELEPAPGLKASRVIGLSDDIARSMSALSARVSTVPGRSVIGIELPNERRERVVLREILAAREFGDAQVRLPLALGKDIGGAPVVANLAKMPHLLIAGTTGSGKSVAINTMILSLLYKLSPEECRLIMIDPKMLELSVYDGIPHLLSPVVTDPKKAVVALKWVVGEMEERYRKMSKMGVRNIDGYNGRVRDALSKGEMFSRTVQTGFDEETGDPVFETDEFTPEVLPYIVVIVDEMADLMMVAGKEIEACIQRLAQMARASGIHLIMATQRPSVDVITGTIKANFPTRISFQVTSKIDSRTILGEQGAEQLLGQGDMLYMAGGGRITRIHGPFCSDEEVEEIVTHLKSYGPPDYMAAVLEEPPEEAESSEAAPTGGAEGDDALYDMAVQIVAKDRKCSTSYIQRKLAIGYNKAARLVEQMEEQGVVTRANQVGKREILVPEPH